MHCEEPNRYNPENFQSQSEFKRNSHYYMKNSQNFTNYFIKNNNLLQSMFQPRQNLNTGFTAGLNTMPTNSIQNFYPVNSNPINIQNYENTRRKIQRP